MARSGRYPEVRCSHDACLGRLGTHGLAIVVVGAALVGASCLAASGRPAVGRARVRHARQSDIGHAGPSMSLDLASVPAAGTADGRGAHGRRQSASADRNVQSAASDCRSGCARSATCRCGPALIRAATSNGSVARGQRLRQTARAGSTTSASRSTFPATPTHPGDAGLGRHRHRRAERRPALDRAPGRVGRSAQRRRCPRLRRGACQRRSRAVYDRRAHRHHRRRLGPADLRRGAVHRGPAGQHDQDRHDHRRPGAFARPAASASR